MSRQRKSSSLPPPYLKRVWIDAASLPADRAAYPFNLKLWQPDFEWCFEHAVTILVGENGAGKSTLLEAIAALAGYDSAGGGKGYVAVDHAGTLEGSGAPLAAAFRAAWKPKVTNGWFFRAESFFSVARYLDAAGSTKADFLSHSHGEGFLRFFEERCSRHGLYIFDEPEAALSPTRLVDFMKLLRRIQAAGNAQVLIATHAPMLMALPDADLVRISKGGLSSVSLQETEHFRLTRAFCLDPAGFLAEQLADDPDAA